MYFLRQMVTGSSTTWNSPIDSFEMASFKHAISTPVTVLLSALDDSTSYSLKKNYRHALLTLKQLCSVFTSSQKESCNVKGLLNEISVMLTDSSHHVKIIPMASEGKVILKFVNSSRFKEALICLVRNAQEANATMPGNSVIVVYTATADHLYIQVKDFGDGMSWWQKKLAVIPFISFKAKGSGIGMAFAKVVIEQELGGTMVIHTAPGLGTSVECKIPIVR